MAKFKINKNKNYTTISNYHLQDTNLSLKAKGLLSLMLSLPDNWDYSVRGLAEICIETKDTINGILNELENNNYLVRKRIYENGKIIEWEYNIYESNDLHPKKQDIEKQDIGFYDNNKILNNKILNNKESNNINIITKESSKRFVKPTIEEIQKYCSDRNNNVDANYFYDFYESKGWMIGKNKMKDWKSAIRTWEKNNKEVKTKSKKDKGWEDEFWNE